MITTKKFCRPTNDGKSYQYAPSMIFPNPGVPTEEEYNANDWYRNEIEPPDTPAGKIVASVLYRVENNAVVAEYTYEDAPSRVRTFSKYKLYLVLTEMGVWEQFETWLKTKTINGRNAHVAFTIANDLTDENEMFNNIVQESQEALGISDEQLAQILAYSEVL